MCMIMMMAGIKKQKVSAAWKFLEKIEPYMSRANDDGIGYAAMTSKGELFGERWVENKEFNNDGDKLTEMIDDSVLVYIESKRNSFGNLELKNEASAIMLHTRKATCVKNIENTHPFVRDNTALIHNGIIHNVEKLKLITSTCDSETILNEYIDSEVNTNPENIEFLAAALDGYYAVGVLSQNGDTPIMDIFKNSGASLSATYVRELETVVFCTSEYALKSALDDMKWKTNRIISFAACHFLRLDVVSGLTVTTTNFQEYKKPEPAFSTRRSKYNQYEGYEDDEETILTRHVGEVGLAAIVTEFYGEYEGGMA